MPQILEYGILLNKPALALQEAEVVTFAVTNTLLGNSAIWTCCRHRGALRVRLGLRGAALRAPVPGPWAGRLPPRLCCLQPLQRGVCACCHLVSMDSDAITGIALQEGYFACKVGDWQIMAAKLCKTAPCGT